MENSNEDTEESQVRSWSEIFNGIVIAFCFIFFLISVIMGSGTCCSPSGVCRPCPPPLMPTNLINTHSSSKKKKIILLL